MVFKQIDIETHNVCNRRCTYCPVYFDKRGPENFMAWPMFQKIVKGLREIGFAGRVNLNLYNEPLLDPLIVQHVQELRDYKVHIYTNGDYLNKDVLCDLMAAGVTSLTVTDHNPKPNPRLEAIRRDGERMFGKRFILRRFHASSVLHNRGGIIEDPRANVKSPVCWPMDPHAYIDFKGDMIGCCDDAFSSHSFGNVAEKTIKEIWESPEYVAFRDGLHKGKYYHKFCVDCNFNAGRGVKIER